MSASLRELAQPGSVRIDDVDVRWSELPPCLDECDLPSLGRPCQASTDVEAVRDLPNVGPVWVDDIDLRRATRNRHRAAYKCDVAIRVGNRRERGDDRPSWGATTEGLEGDEDRHRGQAKGRQGDDRPPLRRRRGRTGSSGRDVIPQLLDREVVGLAEPPLQV